MERSRRHLDPMPEMQQVEEISPSGVKRQVFNAAAGMPAEGQHDAGGPSPDRMIDPNRVEMIDQSTGKAMNPFIDEQQDIDSQMQPRNMFSVKFGGSQSQNTMNEMDNNS